MGKFLTFKWGRAAKPKELPPPEENPAHEAEKLRQKEGRRLFANARLHDQCRTLSFGPEDDPASKAVWYEALDLGGPSNWQVKEISAIFHDAARNGPVQDFVIKGHNLSYFEAVDMLAAFENSQKGIGDRVQTGPTKAELEFTYFRDMAEHEGIIFDVENLPHPTLHGEIITNGKFTEEALKTAHAFRRDDRLYEAKNIGLSLIRNMVIGNTSPISEARAREIFDKSALRSQLRELVDDVSTIYQKMKLSLTQLDNDLGSYRDDQHLANFANALLENRLPALGKSIKKLPLPKQDKARLLNIPDYYGMIFFMMAGRYTFARGNLGNDEMAENTEHCLKNAVAFARRAGAREEDIDNIRGYVLRPDIPENLAQTLPPQMKEYLNEIKRLRDIIDDDLKRSAGRSCYNRETISP